MVEQKNRLDMHVDKTENLVKYLLRKKKKNIQNSLVRPLYQEVLKSLFYICILLLDALIPLELYSSLSSPFNIVVSLAVFGVFLYVEIRLYNMIWGKKGCWSLEHYKNHSKQKKEHDDYV